MIFENAGSGAGFIFEKKAGDLPDRVPGRSLYFLPFCVIVIEGQRDGQKDEQTAKVAVFIV